MWVEAMTTTHSKLISAQIPAVDWIVQFDPPDDPRGMDALTSSCKMLLILIRLYTSGRTNSTRGMYSSSTFPCVERFFTLETCFKTRYTLSERQY